MPASGTLFRRSAVEHYLASDERGEVIRIAPPWTWAILGVMAAVLGAAILLSVFGRIEVTDRGTGILRPKGGVRTVVAQTGGVITQVGASSGERVEAGTVIAHLTSADLQAELLEADRTLRVLRSDAAAHLQEIERRFSEQETLLQARIGSLQDVIASQQQSVETFQRRLQRSEEMQRSGLVSASTVDDAHENLSQSQRTLSASRQNLAQTRQELSALQARRREEVWQSEQRVQTAQSKRDGLALLLNRTEIRTPVVGDVEAMTVKVGDVVQPGQTIARLVPRDVDYQVTSFLPEKDRAFVKVGDEVKLELEQLPYTEFGSLAGRVLRIGGDLSTAQDIRETMGDDRNMGGATYRVDIGVQPSSSGRLQHVALRTGMMMNVRYTLRRERPIVVFFPPLRRWLNS
jgi:multidrug resistance efflux pump